MFCELSDSILDDESPIGDKRSSDQTVLGAILRYPRSESYSADNVIEKNLSYLNGEGKSPNVRGKGWERLTIIIQ